MAVPSAESEEEDEEILRSLVCIVEFGLGVQNSSHRSNTIPVLCPSLPVHSDSSLLKRVDKNDCFFSIEFFFSF